MEQEIKDTLGFRDMVLTEVLKLETVNFSDAEFLETTNPDKCARLLNGEIKVALQALWFLH